VEADIDAAWRAIERAHRPRLHIFLATSDLHLTHKLRITRDQALERIAVGVRHARERTSNVQFSPEDASRSDKEFLVEAVCTAVQAGASTINLTDTVGYATPAEFASLVAFVRARVNEPSVTYSVHCHDDLGLAAANSLAAIAAGASQIECTVNGLGERAGNCSLEEVVMALRTRRDVFGADTRVNARELTRTSQLVSELTGVLVAPNKAVVGENSFAHASGVHQDGMIKHPGTYEIMRPQDVGAPSSRLVLTARSGRRAVATRLTQLGHSLDEAALARAFLAFKRMADHTRVVTDEQLRSIVDAS
jgi:2-isopropylmalate synthase